MKRIGIVALTAAGALLLTACGSANSDTPSGGSSGPAAGAPIKIVGIDDGVSDKAAHDGGVKAALQEINSAGGIKGHQIEFSRCETKSDPNVGTKCARDAVADSGVLAIVDSVTSLGSVIVPITTGAKMASIGTSSGDKVFASAFGQDFPTGSGAVGIVGAVTVAAKSLHYKKISLIYIDAPSVSWLPPIADKEMLGPLGLSLVAAVPLPPTATDVSSVVAKATADNPDVLVLAVSRPQALKIVKSARQLGRNMPMILPGTVGASDIKSQLEGTTQDLYVAGYYNQRSAGFTQLQTSVAKYAPELQSVDDGSIGAYVAVKLFAQAAEQAKSLTREGILEAIRSLSAVTNDGLTQPLDFTKKQTVAGGALPAVANLWLNLTGKYEDGKLTPVTGATDWTPIFSSS